MAVLLVLSNFRSLIQRYKTVHGQKVKFWGYKHWLICFILKEFLISEIRDVKLIGTIIQNPLTLKDGAKVLTVKTVQPDGY